MTNSVAPVSSASSKRSPFIAGCLGIFGLVIIVSTFLQWVSATGGYFIISSNPTGWDFMVHGGSTGFGNFAYISAGGVLYFSGFWSLVLGLAVINGAVLLFMRIGLGGIGIDVVLFRLMSVCSVIAGELGHRVL